MTPGTEELQASVDFFCDLEAALSSHLPERMPELSGLAGHLENFQRAAAGLDNLPPAFWKSDAPYNASMQYPLMSDEIIRWGANRRRFQTWFKETVKFSAYCLRDAGLQDPQLTASAMDSAKLYALISFRVMATYVGLRKHFDTNGLPEGLTEF